MLKKEKEKFYIIMATAILTGLALIWGGIFSSRMAIGSKVAEVLDKKASIGAYTEREESLPGVISNYNSTRDKIIKVNERFVSSVNSVDVDRFFGELENISSETSVSLEKVFIDNPEAAKKTVKKSPAPSAGADAEQPVEEDKFLRLTLNGKYENILGFIYKLEAMPYFIDIKSVNISAAAASRQDTAVKKNDSKNDLQSIVIIKVFKKQEINGK